MMNEKLKDKVVAIELAGNNILIANNNDNFKNELISLGFEKVEPSILFLCLLMMLKSVQFFFKS